MELHIIAQAALISSNFPCKIALLIDVITELGTTPSGASRSTASTRRGLPTPPSLGGISPLLLFTSLGNPKDWFQNRPNVFLPRLEYLFLQERQIVTNISGTCLQGLWSIDIPVAVDPNIISLLQLFQRQNHGCFIFFPH